MPDIDTMTAMVEFLKTGGGWALSVVLMAAVVYLYRTSGRLLEESNNELKALIGECRTVIAENGAFMDRLEDATDTANEVLHVNADRLQSNSEALKSCAEHLHSISELLQRVKLLLEDLRR